MELVELVERLAHQVEVEVEAVELLLPQMVELVELVEWPEAMLLLVMQVEMELVEQLE